MPKEFSLDGILWFPISELNQVMKEVYPKIPRSEVLYRKTYPKGTTKIEE